jgi:hypothetical protein
MMEGAMSALGPRAFGEGPLSRVASFVYTLLAVEIMLLVASLPGIVPAQFLRSDPSNLPLLALCAIPLGPALSAAIYAVHLRSTDMTDLQPVAKFWYGYRLNARGVLPVWIVGLVWLTIVAVTLGNLHMSGFPGWFAILLGLVGIVALLWTTNALVISSLFAFRVVDVFRLSWYMIGRAPLAMLGNVGVLAIAVALAFLTSGAVVAVFAVVLVAMLMRTSRPLIDIVTAEFTGPTDPPE